MYSRLFIEKTVRHKKATLVTKELKM